ncbi:MAG: alpha-rhamnosidase [Prevotella sp.]|nr:alpha-rhamnosidase [Prevotella sp.]
MNDKTPHSNLLQEAPSNPATWIWYPGDFEVWLGNIFNNRRTERGAMFPPFWKQDSHYVTVEFSKVVTLDRPETITVTAEGQYNVQIDGRLQFPSDTYVIPAGEHRLNLKVWNQATPPALYVKGDTIGTDATWLATYEDKLWIDENGVAHGSGLYVPAASWHFDSPDTPPSSFHLMTESRRPVSAPVPVAPVPGGSSPGLLYDFGRETFGYLVVHNLRGTVRVYYGESREEALDKEHCETLDVITAQSPVIAPTSSPTTSKAFRFVYIEKDDGATYDDVTMLYEYAPHDADHTGSFQCNDDLLNRIWDVAAYTMDLTTREFFMDGIKRDRWTWSGDAVQSYLMNYYLRFDTDCVKRTIRQLRGKDPVTAHVNTIMDYTFYWFKSVIDYYQYTADADFVREMWPRMVTLMDYVLRRTNADGMAEGQPDDWIFVDWVDFPMHKRGTLCFEQILLYQALDTMARCQRLLSTPDPEAATPDYAATVPGSEAATVLAGSSAGPAPDYAALAAALRRRIRATFWSPGAHAYLHAVEDGHLNPQVTKFPNMFAILYGLSAPDEQLDIMQHVMLNPDIDPITTPYMRFYELEALCMAGLQNQVLREIRDYWGGMLHEGATSFWEKYVPAETGTQHLAMYGRPYGKSLCHAWGASPVYLLGRYFLGVRPTRPGYEEFEVRPHLGDLDWMEGDVPTPKGLVHVYMDKTCVRVRANEGHGWLIIGDQRIRIEPNQDTTIRYCT